MSEGSTTIEETKGAKMKTWQVNYNATYWVRAETEEEALELGMEKHYEFPDGDFDAFIDPYDSDNFNDLGEK